MNAEIISVGTELLLGQVVNTDATAVAQELCGLGINLLHMSVVGDNPKRLDDAVKLALSRSDLLVMTGGLGPTTDDLTKETVAAAAGKKLVLHEESLQRLRDYFHTDDIPENQRKQAFLPEGCTVLKNDNGTAPGCAFTAENGCTVIMLPGPPSELVPMLQKEAVPYLKNGQESVIVSHNIRIYGKGEALVAKMMDDLMDSVSPTLAPYAKEGECYLRVTAKAATTEEADALCKPMMDEICSRLGDYVYGIDADSLEETVVSLLREKGMHLSLAESCTGGLLAKRITDVSGASDVLEMGFVTYSNRAKQELLGVPQEILDKHGAVSVETAKAMAEGTVKKSGADLAVSITGVAGPNPSEGKPVGLIYVGLSDGKQSWVAEINNGGRRKNREWHRHCAASRALEMVRRYVCGLPILPELKSGR